VWPEKRAPRGMGDMHKLLKCATAVAAVLIFSTSALAASDAEKKCSGTAAQGITPDMVIEGCSQLITEADNPAALAPVYYNRGNAYFDKKDWSNAVADYTKALNLRPKYPTAMNNRGIAKLHMGDKAGGDADMAAAKAMAN
jgi:tetratricopeptide (TPR) repeat protein